MNFPRRDENWYASLAKGVVTRIFNRWLVFGVDPEKYNMDLFTLVRLLTRVIQLESCVLSKKNKSSRGNRWTEQGFPAFCIEGSRDHPIYSKWRWSLTGAKGASLFSRESHQVHFNPTGRSLWTWTNGSCHTTTRTNDSYDKEAALPSNNGGVYWNLAGRFWHGRLEQLSVLLAGWPSLRLLKPAFWSVMRAAYILCAMMPDSAPLFEL